MASLALLSDLLRLRTDRCFRGLPRFASGSGRWFRLSRSPSIVTFAVDGWRSSLSICGFTRPLHDREPVALCSGRASCRRRRSSLGRLALSEHPHGAERLYPCPRASGLESRARLTPAISRFHHRRFLQHSCWRLPGQRTPARIRRLSFDPAFLSRTGSSHCPSRSSWHPSDRDGPHLLSVTFAG